MVNPVNPVNQVKTGAMVKMAPMVLQNPQDQKEIVAQQEKWAFKARQAPQGFKGSQESQESQEFQEHKERRGTRGTQEMTECSPQKQRRPLQLPPPRLLQQLLLRPLPWARRDR